MNNEPAEQHCHVESSGYSGVMSTMPIPFNIVMWKAVATVT